MHRGDIMDTSKLLEYLSIIIDLEKNKYTQEKTIKNINNSISSYQSEFNNNLSLNEKSDNIRQNISNFESIKVDESGKGIMYFMIYYVGCIGAGLGVIAYNIANSMGIAIILGIIGAVIGGSIPVLVWKNIMKNRRERTIIQVQRGMRADNELKQNRQLRNNEISLVVPKLEAEKKSMQETYQLTCQTLKKCYEINIIPVKYRNIVPVCMFYDYILNGRTYSLKRNPNAFDEGAINMYEDEIFRNIIKDKLDIIINKLDDLREGQKVLCRVIEEGNRQTHKLLNDINSNVTRVNDNLQTIQYQNEQRNRCLEYMSYVTYQRYMS